MKANVLSGAKLLIASAAIAALASCGGGGGDGGVSAPPPTLALNATNAPIVAGAAAAAAMDTPAQAGFFVLSADGQSSATPKTHVLSRFMSQQIDRVNQHLQSQSRILPRVPQTIGCLISGTYTIDSTATSASLTFSACSDFTGESINGSVTISNITSTASSFSATVTINVTFSQTGFPNVTTTGSFNISATVVGTATTITISGTQALTTTRGTSTLQVSHFSFRSTFNSATGTTTDTISYTISGTGIGGSVNVSTPTAFETLSGRSFPHTGVLVITGLSSSVKITVLGDETLTPGPQVRIEVDADGNGTFETTLTTTWAQLMA